MARSRACIARDTSNVSLPVLSRPPSRRRSASRGRNGWWSGRGARAAPRSPPQLAFYLAGADPYEGDRLGRLKLTKTGLARRDERVLGTLAARHIPVAIAMAGGYARDIEDSVDIHANTIRTARRIWEAA